jgi:cytochrome c-type biogenesis protein CcmH
MMLFWILAAGLMALALAFVLPPLLSKKARAGDPSQDELNLAVFRRQLQELDADLASGELEQAQYETAKRDLERELLHDVAGGGAGNDDETGTSKGREYFFDAVAGVAGVLVLLVGITFFENASMDANTQDALRELLAGHRSGKILIGVAFALGVGLRRMLSRIAFLRRLVGDARTVAVLFSVGIPALVVALYLNLGDPSIIPRLETATTIAKMPSLDVMVQRLATKLEQHPENLQGWMMLGRTYFAIGQPEQALPAMEKAYGLAPENPDVLVLYAEALAANHEGELAGRPSQLILAALKIDPQHRSARWLEGLGNFQAGEYQRAAEQWEALLPSFDPGSEGATELQDFIAEARKRAASESSSDAAPTPEQRAQAVENPSAGEKVPPVAAAAPSPEKPTAPPQGAVAPGVQVEVVVADSLRSRVGPDDSLFVYAKALSGPPMPLAARRARAGDLPLSLTLDDSTAVMPTMKLSQFEQVTVGARISKSGQAMPQSGDLEGEVSPVETGQVGKVKILIDRVRH